MNPTADYKVKQVIIVRKDLKMGTGKIAAQVAHASMACILQKMISEQNFSMITRMLVLKEDNPMNIWLTDRFAKICLYCENEEVLLAIQDRCNTLGLTNALITDSGFTCFNNVPTNTCIAVGPDFNEVIDSLTSEFNLKLIYK